jgi:hypothetical protein
VAADTGKNHGRVIHPKGFTAPELLEQARLKRRNVSGASWRLIYSALMEQSSFAALNRIA